MADLKTVQAEWGYVYQGSVKIYAVDENGKNQVDTLNTGDIWYFPKGQAHSIQGLEDQNEYLLAFDDGNFDATGTTFNVDDWITHTPKDILAKNFGTYTCSLATFLCPTTLPVTVKSVSKRWKCTHDGMCLQVSTPPSSTKRPHPTPTSSTRP